MDQTPQVPNADEPDEEFTRMVETVQRSLALRRIPVAEEAARLLLRKYPGSTTTHECLGDLYLAEGKRKQARDEYKKALEIEPANADAERKYAEAMLVVGEQERTRALMESGKFEELKGAVNKDAGGGLKRSLVFPGLGQLYNGEYEKGLVATGFGLVFLGLTIWGLGELLASMAGSRSQPMSVSEWMGLIMGIVGYGLIYAWSIWDAQQSE